MQKKKEKGEKGRKREKVLFGCGDKEREMWMLREMNAERVREFIVLGLIVPAHVRVHSWGKRGKWGTDVLYQTQRPELQ